MRTHSGVGQHLVMCVCHVMGAAVCGPVFHTPHTAHIKEITTAIESTQVLLTGTFETRSS